MVHISPSQLAIAVSRAGGLGLIGAGAMNLNEFEQEVIKAKQSLNDEFPFGVNLPMIHQQLAERVEVCKKHGVGVFFTSAGNPAKVVPLLKDGYDCTIVHVVPSVKGAKKAEAVGCDAIVCEGYEAGGHNGLDETTTFTLVPQVAEAVSCPVIAAGGIADGRGIAAAFILGAEGVQMGTRFVATTECPAHQNFKSALVESADCGTCITGRKLNMLRVLRNDFSIRMWKAEHLGAGSEELIDIIGQEDDRAISGMVNGDITEGVFDSSCLSRSRTTR